MDSQKVKNKSSNSKPVQLIWGISLALMGIGVFFRIPHVIAKISDSGQTTLDNFFIRFSLYLMAVLLFGGGVKKLYGFWRIHMTKNGNLE